MKKKTAKSAPRKTEPAPKKATRKASKPAAKKVKQKAPAAPKVKRKPSKAARPELELPPLRAPEVVPRPVGRPSLYSDALAESICTRIAEGESLRSICRDNAMPEMGTVLRWRLTNKEFSEQYAQAREIQAETFYDELIEIADDGTNDFESRIRKNGTEVIVPMPEMVMRSRLRADVRKWAMSKILVRRYGNKPTDVTGKEGGPVVFTLKRVDQE